MPTEEALLYEKYTPQNRYARCAAMSIRIMTLVWNRTDLSSTEKLVALALADWCNDEGLCWPSIARLAEKSSLGTRTIQKTIRLMEERGLIERETLAGKGNRYWIRMDTPAPDAPLHQMHPTPAPDAPNTLKIHQTIDKSGLPDWMPLDAWNGWLEMRKEIKKPVTGRAIERAISKLDAMREAGQNIADVLDRSTMNNWLDLYEIKERKTHNGKATGNHTADRRSSLARAIDEGLDFLG